METKKCKCCGRDLPLGEFGRSPLGVYNTCKECVKKNQSVGRSGKKTVSSLEKDVEKAKVMRLSEFSPRDLMAELKRRGYKGRITYVETHTIDLSAM